MTDQATMRTVDDTTGAVHIEDIFDTDIDDLWQACTVPERLERWIATVTGERRSGGTVHAVFTSTWTGSMKVEACEAPHHLLLTTQPGSPEQGELEAWLAAEGSRTRLVVEERGLPIDTLHFYGAGWQAHLEDLGSTLAGGTAVHPEGWSEQEPAPAWHRRWTELTPLYQG